MFYHILLTERCNSQCKYCYEKSFKEFDNQLDKRFKFDFSSPERSEVDTRKLINFLEKDKDATFIFYGGEPLLEIDKIIEIMDNIPNIPLRMQTNGKLLHKLPIEYVKRIGKILVSIDGSRERTDFNKGKGTYDAVLKNLKQLRREHYKGELVARMTISEFPDLYEQVINIIKLNIFDSIHWQIDAGFYKFDYNKEKFEKFVEEYNKSISKLIDFWINEMKQGRIHKLYPFMAIVDSILKKEKTKLRCGAGHSGYAITTNGKIVACPIMNCIEDFQAGTISDNPRNLLKFEVPGCSKCSHLDLCGGRCLYWRSAKLWPKEGDDLICKTIKHYIDEIKKRIPEIQDLLNREAISKKAFDYEKYFGPEIIP